MRWRVLAILAMLCLALFFLNLAVWLRGYGGYVSLDWFVRQEDTSEYRDVIRVQATSDNGGLMLHFAVYHFAAGFETPNQPRWHIIAISRNLLGDPYSRLVHFDFRIATPETVWDGAPVNADTKRSGRFITLETPHWLPAALLAILPVLWLRRHVRNRWVRARQTKGLCLTCGYDLRAHHPGQQCPECGTAISVSGAMPTPVPTDRSRQSERIGGGGHDTRSA